MTTTFLNALKQQDNLTETENGAITNKSSLSACVDFFAQGGSIRYQDNKYIIDLFKNAYNENKNIALKLMFMFRDIRQGQGQRKPFKIQLKWLIDNHPNDILPILNFVSEYGRWDDLYPLLSTQQSDKISEVINNQLNIDLINIANDKPISLLGKWLPRINTSSKETRTNALRLRKFFNIKNKEYRQLCVKLSNHINVFEQKISRKDWSNIDYTKLPGQCLLKYKKAFLKHDTENYNNYIKSVQDGSVKINASTIYPFQIVKQVLEDKITENESDAFWKNIPKFETDPNAIVVADVSGSMMDLNRIPISVCISLALYFSERSKGPYKGHFITFSSVPSLEKVIGETIFDQVKNLNKAHWDGTTNINSVFNLILDAAIENKISQEEMVDKIYIISDMEFDQATGSYGKKPLAKSTKEKFNNAGYKLPKLVFWNVNSKQANYPVLKDEPDTCMISGFNPSVLKYFMQTDTFPTSEELMMTIINSERYKQITIDNN